MGCFYICSHLPLDFYDLRKRMYWLSLKKFEFRKCTVKFRNTSDGNVLISYVILGVFIFVPLLLCPSVSSDLTSRARKRKNFARAKFMWPVDNVIKNNLLVQVGLLCPWYAAVCKPVRYCFLFSLWFPVCFKWLKSGTHEIFQSQSVAPPTQQATYIPYCKVTLLHTKSVNKVTRLPAYRTIWQYCGLALHMKVR